MELLFWVSLAVLGYTFLGYPGLVAALSRLRPRFVKRRPVWPNVSLLLVAHNEERWIDRKLKNCLDLEYPRDRLEIVVASDGSTDGTAEIARKYETQGVTVVGFEMRRGKPSVLNDVMPKLWGEVVVLSDIRQFYDRRVLVKLMENFGDPSVGAVTGELVITNEAGTAVGEGAGIYWRYEKFIRRCEAALDSIPVVTGAIYAIRRDLFEPIPADTLVEDMLIPLRIVRRGYRVLLDSRALAYDLAVTTASAEFTRKVRTIAGNFQLFVREKWLLNPLRNRLWFQTISHKGLRLVAPVFLLGIFAANLTIPHAPLYLGLFVGQVLFYVTAVVGFFLRNRRGRGSRWFSGPYMFCLLNFATVVSFYRFVTKRQTVTWRKVR